MAIQLPVTSHGEEQLQPTIHSFCNRYILSSLLSNINCILFLMNVTVNKEIAGLIKVMYS